MKVPRIYIVEAIHKEFQHNTTF